VINILSFVLLVAPVLVVIAGWLAVAAAERRREP
jgi:hypothetical protein